MPTVRYRCDKCKENFELTRPPDKANDYINCPKCGKPCAPIGATAYGGPARQDEPIVKGKEMPAWAKGQIEAQLRQLIKGNDSVGSEEIDLITQAVLRDLAAASLDPTPANIRVMAQKHMADLDSWAHIARRAGAQLDEAAKLDDED